MSLMSGKWRTQEMNKNSQEMALTSNQDYVILTTLERFCFDAYLAIRRSA